MANITADNTAAFITYIGEWDDSNETTRRTSTAGAALSLEFSGTALSVYGEYNPDDFGNFAYQLFDEQELSNNMAIIQAANTADRPFLAFHNLTKRPHTLTLSLVNGSLGVNRLVWFDPQASTKEGPVISASNDSAQVQIVGAWEEQSNEDSSFRITNETSASITFTFNGAGIMVLGLTGPTDGTFNATLDDQPPVARNATSNNQHLSVLHRNDGLSPAQPHKLTLTKTGGANLRVSQAHIFAGTPSNTTNPTTSISSPAPHSTSATMGTSTPSVLPIPATSSGLGKGAKAGVAIGVLAIVSLFVLAALLWFRRRQARAGVFEKNKAAFERICSKCRLEITGDYRLECVQPDCPAAVDLHPECKDWNVQVNHDHEVHEVPNK